MRIYPRSEVSYQGTKYFLAREDSSPQAFLCVEGDHLGFHGEEQAGVYICKLTPHNAAVLRERLPWLKPSPLGLSTSFGFGDRLGIATPGHVAAVEETGIAPIFAQQSVRENARTGRTPQRVLDDAMWGLFQMGWREVWGADADHIKTIADLQPFLQAGYTFYTIDPSDHVDNEAQTDSLETLRDKASHLPWDRLQTSLETLHRLYDGKPVEINGTALKFQEHTLLKAVVKYGRAIAQIKSMADELKKHLTAFDLEASVDETDTPTSVHEHYFIASELRRLEVPFVSLAPRFVGRFEKGVDYIGDLTVFDGELQGHAAVMQRLGGYKLSVHTGSDKFSIYPSIAAATRNRVHVKTAGTSYLEALRVVATADPEFFRQVLDFARSRYPIDRASYHVSAELEKVSPAAGMTDEALLEVFEQFDARQVLHVTFGSVLESYGARLIQVLAANRALYVSFLERHFRRHLEPFVQQAAEKGAKPFRDA